MNRMNAILTMIVAATMSCTDNVESRNDFAENESDVGYSDLITKTLAFPTNYSLPSTKRGTVKSFEYSTLDYADGTNTIRQNEAYIYLPYGYEEDTERKYDVLYLVHGHYGDASTFMTVEDGLLVNMLDNMIEQRDIEPLIVVTPTYNYGQPTSSYVAADKYCKALPTELRNDLIPYVESHFRTYTESYDAAGLSASRQHRAIGGFSMGAVTTWYAFDETLSLFKYFLPMSGDCWSLGSFAGMNRPGETAQYLADRIKEQGYSASDFYIWAASGTDDSAYSEILLQIEGMAKLGNVFSLNNMSFHEKEGARHEYRPMMEYIYNALPYFFPKMNRTESYFSRSTLITDVMADPAFGNYGRLIFPAQTGYWSGNTLEQLRLTYYNNIDPDMTVEIVNYMKSHAVEGETIFYDIYSDEEKLADADKRNTGLFFFRGRQGAPFAVCNAGGAFAYVGAMHDSFPHALELSKKGYNAFAFIYRPDDAYEDLARAIEFIHDNAERLGVSKEGYSLWGGSAGARMAATLGNSSHMRQLTGRTDIPQAATVVMQYTGYSDANRYDAPTYVCVGTSDGIASWRTMQSRLERLEALGIPTEFHAYNGLPHGFGLGTGTVAEGWINDAVRFWERQSGMTAVSQVKADTKSRQSVYSIDGTRRGKPQKGLNIINNKKIVL
ncbi:MAG: alpha/beta hydrolase-fold protein [Prevotella sp.]